MVVGTAMGCGPQHMRWLNFAGNTTWTSIAWSIEMIFLHQVSRNKYSIQLGSNSCKTKQYKEIQDQLSHMSGFGD